MGGGGLISTGVCLTGGCVHLEAWRVAAPLSARVLLHGGSGHPLCLAGFCRGGQAVGAEGGEWVVAEEAGDVVYCGAVAGVAGVVVGASFGGAVTGWSSVGLAGGLVVLRLRDASNDGVNCVEGIRHLVDLVVI